MKGGVTKRIEDTVKALEQGQLKKALVLTETSGLERHRQFVEQAARTCLANKDNKEGCAMAIEEAKEKVKDTITLPEDDTSLEGLEEYLTPEKAAAETQEAQPTSETTDEELYEECEECHIANAIVAATVICEEHPQTACSLISSRLDKEDVEPEEWLKVLVDARDKSEGEARQEFDLILDDLMGYLQRRDSPFLKAIKGEG